MCLECETGKYASVTHRSMTADAPEPSGRTQVPLFYLQLNLHHLLPSRLRRLEVRGEEAVGTDAFHSCKTL